MFSSILQVLHSPVAAAWAAAFGALALVGWAMWKYFDARKIKLECSCVGSVVLSMGSDDPTEICISVDAVNVGYRPVTVESVTFRCVPRLFAKWRKKGGTAFPLRPSEGSSSIPIMLSDGDAAKWLYSQKFVNELVEKLATTEKEAKSVRCIIRTTHGHTFQISPDAGVIGMLFEAIRNKS